MILINVNNLFYTINIRKLAPSNLSYLNVISINAKPKIGSITNDRGNEILNVDFLDSLGSFKSNGCYSIIGIGSGLSGGNICRLAVYTNRIFRRAVKVVIIISLDYNQKIVGSACNEGILFGKHLISNGIHPENTVDVADFVVLAENTITDYLCCEIGSIACSGSINRNINSFYRCNRKCRICMIHYNVCFIYNSEGAIGKTVYGTAEVLRFCIKIISAFCYKMYCRLIYITCVKGDVLTVVNEIVTLLTEPLYGYSVLTVGGNLTVGKSACNGSRKITYTYVIHRCVVSRYYNHCRSNESNQYYRHNHESEKIGFGNVFHYYFLLDLLFFLKNSISINKVNKRLRRTELLLYMSRFYAVV